MRLEAGQAHLSKDVCIKELHEAIMSVGSALDSERAKSSALSVSARIAWLLISRMPEKSVILTEQELASIPAGAGNRATVLEDKSLKIEAAVARPQGVA